MKQIDELIDSLSSMDMTYSVRSAVRSAMILQLYRTEIESVFTKYPSVNLSVDDSSITLKTDDRKVLMCFLQTFGGEWKKEVNTYFPDKMDYVQEILHPFRDKSKDFTVDEEDYNKTIPNESQSKFSFVAEGMTPPPSCTVVEEEVEVPARKEKRKKIVCDENKERQEMEVTNV